GRHVDGAIGDAAGGLDRLEVPAAVAAVPLIAGVDLKEFVAQPVTWERGAVRGRDDHVKGRVLAFTERAAGEQRLDADHRARRHYRQNELALDRAAAGFRHAHRELRFQPPGRFRLV